MSSKELWINLETTGGTVGCSHGVGSSLTQRTGHDLVGLSAAAGVPRPVGGRIRSTITGCCLGSTSDGGIGRGVLWGDSQQTLAPSGAAHHAGDLAGGGLALLASLKRQWPLQFNARVFDPTRLPP